MQSQVGKNMASAPQPQPGSSTGKTQEYVVRVPKDRQKKYKMMKFSSGTNLDFAKVAQEQTPVRMERENNLKEYKSAHGIDIMPKFGAGSEFGREQKETARRKKYGFMMKKYDPNKQPWVMKVGKTKEAKKYKGVREGTIAENTSYYIFTQCPDGAFEAFPIEEWYNFSPIVKYKYLNSEEAEEEFSRRDKTLNYFSIMVRKRIKNEDDGDNAKTEEGEKTKEKSKKKRGKEFQLTDMDDDDDDDADDGDDDDESDNGDEKKVKKNDKAKKKGKKGAKVKKEAKHNSDDEAVEESDEGDFDDRELDYMTDSDSSLSETGDREKGDLYHEKGVDEERGLKNLLDSDESSEDEDEKKKKEKEKEEAEKKEKRKKEGSDSDSSSSSSGSDSDIDKDEKISSAIFMQKKEKRLSPVPQPDTPSSVEGDDKTSLKRKLEAEASVSKKMRTDSPNLSVQHGSSSGGITEESIRRYLMRKPMTAKELLQKFKSKRLNMTNEAMMSAIATLLKKISPQKQMVKNVMYLSLKKDG